MATFRGLFVRKDSTAGTGPADARKALAGLIHRLGSGAPRQGLLSPVQVVGTTGWAYSVPAAWWVTSRGLADGVVLAGSDGVVTVPTDPAPATGSRIDVIYVLHRDVDQADPDSASVVDVARGVASGTPVAPSIPAGAMEIARATVASTHANTLAATISQTAPYTGLAGADIVVPFALAEFAARIPSPPDGLRVYSLAENAVYVRSGGAWRVLWRLGDGVVQTYTPTFGGVTLGTSPTVAGAYTQIGSMVQGRVRLTLGAGAAVTGLITVSLPFPAAAGGHYTVGLTPIGDARAVIGGSHTIGQCVADSASTLRIASVTNGAGWTTGTPGAWGAGSLLGVSFAYEAA